MKSILFFFLNLLSITAFAETHFLSGHQEYVGDEYVNQEANGNHCYLSIVSVRPLASRGQHCFEVSLKFGSGERTVPIGIFKLSSPIAQHDSPSFLKKKSCAKSVSSSFVEEKMSDDDTTLLYNPLFIGSYQDMDFHFDFTLKLSPKTKLPVSTRVHTTSSLSKADIDCVNLEKI